MTVTIDRVRAFNRRWTQVIGLLDQGLLKTPYSLPEARVLFELAQRPHRGRLELRRQLRMDDSFLTRVLTRLKDGGLIATSPSATDGRAVDVTLTPRGRRAFQVLDRRSAEQVDTLVEPLTPEQRSTLTEAMTVISRLMRPEDPAGDVAFRDLEAGDMGWVIQRNGAIYADEHGWDADFEGLVAKIVADYRAHHRPDRERAWIATVDGARAACVFCCEKDSDTAQLRLLLVEPWARGLGLGTRLVEECIAFARRAGYRKITLWTNDVLVSARRIYQAAGFVLVHEEPHRSFGADLVGQNWDLTLM